MTTTTIFTIIIILLVLQTWALRLRVRDLESMWATRLQTDGDLAETYRFSYVTAQERIAKRALRYNRILHGMPFQAQLQKMVLK